MFGSRRAVCGGSARTAASQSQAARAAAPPRGARAARTFAAHQVEHAVHLLHRDADRQLLEARLELSSRYLSVAILVKRVERLPARARTPGRRAEGRLARGHALLRARASTRQHARAYARGGSRRTVLRSTLCLRKTAFICVVMSSACVRGGMRKRHAAGVATTLLAPLAPER